MEIHQKCRVCLQKNLKEAVSLINVWPSSDLTVSQVYQYVTGFQTIRGPQCLCPGCSDKLNVAYLFKKSCEANEKIFERMSVDVKEKIYEMKIHKNFVFVPAVEENYCDFEDDTQDDCSSKETEQLPEETHIFKCNFCTKTFESEDNLVHHCNKRHREEPFQCPHCDKFCKTYQSCVQHCVSHHPEQQTKCPRNNCSYQYYLSFQLDKHLTKCHGSERISKELKALQCPSCEKTFVKSSHLRKHRLNEHGIKPNPTDDQSKEKTLCPHCGKTLKFSSLASHIQMIHQKSDAGVYICDFCGNNYNSKMSITNHLRYQHMKKGPIVCRYCPETFANDGSRRYHEVTVHTKDYKHICSVCGMKCYNSAIYKRHMISHTGEKPYMCPRCGARFGRKNTLNNHIATHTDIKGFICKICNAAFKTIKSLKTHQNVHQERKYECPVCQQRFLVNQSMRIHCTKTHPDYKLPPPGTVMNKQALQRMHELSMKRPQSNVDVNISKS